MLRCSSRLRLVLLKGSRCRVLLMYAGNRNYRSARAVGSSMMVSGRSYTFYEPEPKSSSKL